MISSKQSVNHLVYLCIQSGIKDVVFSPGSRNAPLVISFNESKSFNCYSIPDERVAGFMALGMSQESKRTSIVCCTSGSAAANYAPAICEAYYQGIPLIVITADRPVEAIDQGVGQSIRQKDMYANFIKGSFELIQEAHTQEDLKANDLIIQKALHLAVDKFPGPVHINIPFHEPLYETNQLFKPENVFRSTNENEELSFELSDDLISIWNNSNRKMVLFGMDEPSKDIQTNIEKLCDTHNVVLLSETCSNISTNNKIGSIDRFITTYEKREEELRPDLLISLGGPVISKKIKKLFKDFKPQHHWYVHEGSQQNTFEALTQHVNCHAESFLKEIVKYDSLNSDDYQNDIMSSNEALKITHNAFLSNCVYSDLKVFEKILDSAPEDSVLHLSNSTPVRYAQLFEQRAQLKYLSNRGVSGIDGCSSTAVGYALNSDKMNILVTGDLAFFYDSNAFLHNYHPDNLKIILINNSGGGIFRIIEGPSSTNQLDEYFEATHNFKGKELCSFFGFNYFGVSDLDELNNKLPDFLQNNEQAIDLMEIMTPRSMNDKILKSYFSNLNQ